MRHSLRIDIERDGKTMNMYFLWVEGHILSKLTILYIYIIIRGVDRVGVGDVGGWETPPSFLSESTFLDNPTINSICRQSWQLTVP